MKFKIQNSKFKITEELKSEALTKVLLTNRGIETKEEIGEFLNPKLESVTIDSVGINERQLKKAIARIKQAIKNKEQIVVFGDYDVDGICGTAILWETLNSLGAKVMPYIPHRIDEGYGLSIAGINNVILNLFQDLKRKTKEMLKPVQHDSGGGLIITVDNGIVANKAVDFANKQGIDVIITDHHVPSKKLPNALAIVHAVKLCGTGVAYLLSRVILNSFQDLKNSKGEMLKQVQHDNLESHLELVALATVADLVPLKGANRTLLKFGLEELRRTIRPGLVELFKEAGLEKEKIGVYEIGHMIAPRLNAMGRLEYAMDSLRLICTNNQKRAADLAKLLGNTNKERQDLTLQAVANSKFKIQNSKSQFKIKKLLFIADAVYEQGIIGLVAGKLVEEFYKPAIVVSIGEKYSKASARSVSGFNIIEFIRSASEFLVDAGGHPMAAGFTVETTKLLQLQKVLESKAEEMLSKDLLTRSLKIDCELPLSFVDVNLYESLQKLAPFGMGNPEPTFISQTVIDDIRLVGNEGKHLKFRFSCHPEFISGSNSARNEMLKRVQHDNQRIEGIGFGMGERAKELKIGDKIDIVYTISQDVWNGEERLQLKIKDIDI